MQVTGFGVVGCGESCGLQATGCWLQVTGTGLCGLGFGFVQVD